MIDVSYQGRVAIVRMNYGKANALDVQLCDALVERFKELELSSAQAVVLTGQGRIFSAGVDLLRATRGDPGYLRDFLAALCRAFESVFFFPKPLVAAMNGHAIAGGCVLACAADKRLMARDSGYVGVNELLVGVPFPTIALEIMRFATLPPFFPEIVFSGATYTPEDALFRGLIDEAVEPERLIERAVVAAETHAALPPAAFALTKRQIRQPVAHRLHNHADGLLDQAARDLWLAPETTARIRDFVSRVLKKS